MELASSRGALWALRVFFALLVVFLYVPLLVLVVFSFNRGDVSFPLQGFTLSWYQRAAQNPSLIAALERSAIVATITSVLAVALGVLAAYALVRRVFRGKSAFSALVFAPLVIPYLVFGISLLVLFKALDKVLISVTGTYLDVGLHAVVIGHVVVALPYTILTILPLLERLSTSLEEAAHDLGASAWQTFWRVTFPLLMPALVSAFMIAFTLSFDEYAIASFLAGNQVTWPVFLFAQLRVPSQLPEMVAVSSVILAISVGLVVASELGRQRSERRVLGEAEPAEIEMPGLGGPKQRPR
jgi:spermidine/putrescine transport system permease protein